MKRDIQITGFKATEELNDFINNYLDQLPRFDDRITEVEVYAHVIKGKEHTVMTEIKAHVPGERIFATGQDSNVQRAFTEAFNRVKQQMIKARQMLTEKRV
ncbi:MAG: HPF/RaiA family ribosome-associated protein [Bacteroidota bacterium]